jgi:flagellar motor switch protein FliM
MEKTAKRIHFGCSLQLPSVRVAASALENLEPGSIIKLDLPANTAPVFRVGGQSLGRAQAIRFGEHRAARIADPVLDALRPDWAGQDGFNQDSPGEAIA